MNIYDKNGITCKYCGNGMSLTNEVKSGWTSHRDYTCSCGATYIDGVFDSEWCDSQGKKEIDMTLDALSQIYECVDINGINALFASERIERSTVPNGLHCYDVRDSDACDGNPCTIEDHVLVNHFGTIICKDALPMTNHNGDLCMDLTDKTGINFLGGFKTIDEYLQG